MRNLVYAGIVLLLALPASAQVNDIAGEWARDSHEDQPHRAPGAELGDYTGLPINAAARQKALSWDASILSQPEQQAKPHPAQYSMRGPQPNLRIAKIVDPVSGRLVAYTLVGHVRLRPDLPGLEVTIESDLGSDDNADQEGEGGGSVRLHNCCSPRSAVRPASGRDHAGWTPPPGNKATRSGDGWKVGESGPKRCASLSGQLLHCQ